MKDMFKGSLLWHLPKQAEKFKADTLFLEYSTETSL